MAFNTQQFESRNDNPPQRVNEDARASIQNLENQTRASIQNLESQMSQLASSVSRLESQVGEEHPKVFVPKPPFPARFAKSIKEEEEKEILETLRKVEVNIPLLDVIKRVLRYAKFLKEMCTNKSKLRGPLKETGLVLQLAGRSIVYPKGVLEDVLVQVNELVFPTDFYVLDMIEDNPPNSTYILLGRPFLKTSKTKIDVDAGILFMEFDNEVVSFSIGGVTQNCNDMHSVFLIEFIDPLVQVHAMFDGGGAFKMSINKNLTSSSRTYKNKAFHEKISLRKKLSMDRQVLLNPHHHWVHYIEEVDLERPTY
ncbi:UNVERIFIED_CONTAM: hypothetical protein Sradi_5235600 [Sesamum radiatum]|uniref:Uncharacterized protein n=1 Tax=Sesamum radiatum TaxID=300843 RepID=A0AAW2LL52_SESRA